MRATKIAKVYVYLVQTPFYPVETPFYPVETLVHLVETLNYCPVDFSLFTAQFQQGVGYLPCRQLFRRTFCGPRFWIRFVGFW